jgi:RHS repeat-associated protein
MYSWLGTLLENKRDASGFDYRRNRVYDPVSGRFTQEDPIGLAGGLNLYGFSAGDPVNFDDPTGTRPLRFSERRALGTVCDEIQCSLIDVHDGHDDARTNKTRSLITAASRGRSITIGYGIWAGDLDIDGSGYIKRDVLIHEAAHVTQFAQWGELKYIIVGAATQYYDTYMSKMYGEPNTAYYVPFPLTSDYSKYGMEQQAVIVQKCARKMYGYCATSPFSFPR